MNPELEYRTDWGSGRYIGLRVDKPELPYKDIRVRRALMMATDFNAIKRDYLGGEAQIVTFPIPFTKEYAGAYYGPDPATGVWPSDVPASVKELYTYNPDKAKQFLREAGFPQGLAKGVAHARRDPAIYVESLLEGGVSLYLDVGILVRIKTITLPIHHAVHAVGGLVSSLQWD
jgi:ABC-type transport system substrate-binding protein